MYITVAIILLTILIIGLLIYYRNSGNTFFMYGLLVLGLINVALLIVNIHYQVQRPAMEAKEDVPLSEDLGIKLPSKEPELEDDKLEISAEHPDIMTNEEFENLAEQYMPEDEHRNQRVEKGQVVTNDDGESRTIEFSGTLERFDDYGDPVVIPDCPTLETLEYRHEWVKEYYNDLGIEGNNIHPISIQPMPEGYMYYLSCDNTTMLVQIINTYGHESMSQGGTTYGHNIAGINYTDEQAQVVDLNYMEEQLLEMGRIFKVYTITSYNDKEVYVEASDGETQYLLSNRQ